MPIVKQLKQEFPKETPAPAPVVLHPAPAPQVNISGVGSEEVTAALRSMEQANKSLEFALKGLLAKHGKKVITATVIRDSQGRMESVQMEVE